MMHYITTCRDNAISAALAMSWILMVGHLSFGCFNLRTIESYWCYITCNIVVFWTLVLPYVY